ncbi:BID domain-containing T4SS effector [Bartonella phoceensis]|uniref:BID domain-containing T4SS effector n=1 Tax=Bartonella phoceensis TaxID=270249 RepID=UPI001ABAFF7D|nr:BID domain-containing T4SS effector [Bartonella phoceensis]
MPLLSKQILNELRNNSDVLQSQEKVKSLSEIVYGNANTLEEEMTKILENPVKGPKLLVNMAQNPESFCSFAGLKILGIRSNARKHAEKHFWTLYNALEQFVRTVQEVHEDIILNQRKQKDLHQQEQPKEAAVKKLQQVGNMQKSGCSRDIHPRKTTDKSRVM